jgi:hypothetical protein
VNDAKLGKLFDIYTREVTPEKGESKPRHDHRQERRRGTLRREGRKGKAKDAGVRDRQIAYDLKFLLSLLNWATLSGDGQEAPLLERNPLKGLPVPKEENPRAHSSAKLNTSSFERLPLGWTETLSSH